MNDVGRRGYLLRRACSAWGAGLCKFQRPATCRSKRIKMTADEKIQSVDPTTGERIQVFEAHTGEQVEKALEKSRRAFSDWRRASFERRSDLLREAARLIRQRKRRLTRTMTSEMGKPVAQAEKEADKCALGLEYFADEGEGFLRREVRKSDASESYIQFLPLGPILAIMPWNYPLWQVVRFAAPALLAGNAIVLKHAPNVPQTALAAEEIFREAGFPEGLFQNLFLPVRRVADVIADHRIAGVTLTGSVGAGRIVASQAGRALKPVVLELGGSDPFIVCRGADLEAAAETGVQARFQNTGQSCIAAKRFLIEASVYPEFEERFLDGARRLRRGDPMNRRTDIGPMARQDLRDALERQVRRTVSEGARVLAGGAPVAGPGFFFEPTVLAGVTGQMTAAREETFGPAAALMQVQDLAEAVAICNDSDYGLGASLWIDDIERARELASEIEAGQVFVNGMVASDPRLPFGGVKDSGVGRELSDFGIREFVNVQTVWIR